MRVVREDFIRQLEMVEAGLSTREQMEQSSCFAFQGGRVITFNDEVSCQAPSLLEEDFEGALVAAPFLESLKLMPEVHLQLEKENGVLKVLGKAGRGFEVPFLKKVGLPLDMLEAPSGWRPLRGNFSEALAMVQECAGKDETKFVTTCVYLHPKFMAATDGIQAIKYRIRTPIKEPLMLRRDSLKEVPVFGMVKISHTGSWAHFKNPVGLIYSCRCYDGADKFPDVGKALDFEGSHITLPKGLGDEVKRAEVFAKLNVDSKRVRITLRPGKCRVVGESAGGRAWAPKKVDYEGPPIQFMVSPDLLVELTKKHNTCEITEKRLKVSGGRWGYTAALGKVEEKDGQP
jgi:hypothetical protein